MIKPPEPVGGSQRSAGNTTAVRLKGILFKVLQNFW